MQEPRRQSVAADNVALPTGITLRANRASARRAGSPIALPARALVAPWIIALAILFCLVYLLRDALIPFVVAAGLACAAAPFMQWMQTRLRTPRWAAAALAYLSYVTLFTALGLLIGRALVPEISQLGAHLPQTMNAFFVRLFRGEHLELLGKTITARGATDALLSGAATLLPASGGAFRLALVGFGAAMGLILTFVLLAYFLFDGPRLLRGILWLVPPHHQSRAREIAAHVSPVAGHYLRGLATIAAFAILVSWIATRFILHLEHAALLAVVVGLLEMIPVIGPAISTTVIGLLAVQQVSWWGIMGFGLFATILRVSIDQFVGPLVLGRALRLPAPVIIFAFIAGGVLLGVLGVLIAVPVAAAAKVVLERSYRTDAGPGNTQARA